MQVVRVIYTDKMDNVQEELSKRYTFRDELGLKAGDRAVVYSKQHDKFGLVKVVSTHDDSFENAEICNRATEYTVTKVDTDALIIREQSKARIEYLRTKLEERLEKEAELSIFESLKDEESKAALAELKQLTLTQSI